MIKGKNIILKNRLKEIRKEQHLTQRELAEKVGVSRQTINAIENDLFCPTALLAALLCGVLDIKFEDIFTLEWRKEK